MKENYYQILGLNNKASPIQIKQAFKKLAFTFHPDKNLGNPDAEEIFKLINEAYQTLSNADKKFVYDSKLNQINLEKAIFTTSSNTQPKATTTQRKAPFKQKPPQKTNRIDGKSILLAFTFMVVIGCICLFGGMLMNKSTAKQHIKLAYEYLKADLYVKSKLEVEKAIDFDENNPDSYKILAQLAILRAGDFREAIYNYNKILTISHRDSLEFLPKRAKAYTQIDKYEEAIMDLKYVLQKNKGQDSVWAEIGKLYLLYLNNLNEAKINYQNAINLKPQNYTYLFGLGICQINLNENEESIISLQKAYSLKKEPKYLYYISKAYQNLGNQEMYCEYLKTSISFGLTENIDELKECESKN